MEQLIASEAKDAPIVVASVVVVVAAAVVAYIDVDAVGCICSCCAYCECC
jgi:hypothetical protein